MRKLILRISAIISGISGVVILVGVFYPILTYNSVYSSNYKNAPDLTKASNWFQTNTKKSDFISDKVKYYSITIPKLRIDKAVVAIGGEDLREHIIQYPGTALPGKNGNAVLFGHSVLPIFYNPKEPISIFSLLPTLKPGDQIFVDYDGVSYSYRVENMFEVGPTDIQILDQDSSDSFLTLVTCVPPGDPRNPRRLIVRARIVPPQT